ncbi:MAG: OmpA family protein [Bacteroidota bacterium]
MNRPLKPRIYAFVLTLAFSWAGCDNAQKTSTNQTATDTAASLPAHDKDTLGRPQELGWAEVQPYDLPIIRSQMTEIDSSSVTVRGNEHFTTYEVTGEVLFDEGKAALKPSAEAKLQQVSTSIASRFPKNEVRIFGYTDALDTKADNNKLSETRAEAVKEWLVKNGNMEASRISIHPMGESHPVASNATASGRKENRRVEIVVRNH